MMGSFRALACMLVLVPAIAAAQPQPTAKQKQEASEKVKKAIAKSQAGDHESAVGLYLDAYAIIPQPLLLSNVGSEYQQMKKPYEALKYFCKYIEADPTGNNVSYATAQARTIYIELGGITTVEDADVCKPIVKPKKEEPSKPIREEKVSPPIGTGPGPDPGPGPGPDEGHTDKPKPPMLRYAGIGVAVIGAGVFGGGIYFGMQAKSISDEITNHNINDPWPPNIKQREQQGKDANTKAIGMMVGGGIAIAAGATMFVLGAPKSEKDTSVSIAPLATGDTLGFAAAGRF